ncbi:MAG: ExbD/TolR family protein [Acidobacteriota bacterium]
MADRWLEDSDTALSAINITPLVDVALVLLIIFMITAPMMVQGADVRLPETRPMDRLPPNAVYLTVNAQGQILLNDVTVSLDELDERLSPFADSGQSAYLRADESLNYGTVMRVMESIFLAGLDIALITKPIPERR